MNTKLDLCVYRRLDNRSEGLSDDSPRALELHNRRKRALHDVLEEEPAWRIEDWGETDDAKPHELVELIIVVLSSPQFQAVAMPAITLVGGIVLKSALDTATSEAVKKLIAKLWSKQQNKEILDYQINLPDGTSIRVYPEDDDAEITIRLKNGKTVSLHYNATPEEVNRLDDSKESTEED